MILARNWKNIGGDIGRDIWGNTLSLTVAEVSVNFDMFADVVGRANDVRGTFQGLPG